MSHLGETPVNDIIEGFIANGGSKEIIQYIKDLHIGITKTPLLKHIYSSLTVDEMMKNGIRSHGDCQHFLQYLEDLKEKPFRDKRCRPPKDLKIFNDPIHGNIQIHPACLLIVDTPQFQRLRYIRQLGFVYFVYPGAAHNRFEHCLGVCHMSGQFARVLMESQPELGITEVDILCVQIAGLCRDLGHGPFSRVYVCEFLPAIKKSQYTKPSASMLKHLLDKNELNEKLRVYGIEDNDIQFIMEMIEGTRPTGSTAWPYKGRPKEKAFLYEIVVNKRNGIDVYKWDYLARDCVQLGIKNNFDPFRYMKFARVIEVEGEMQICIRDKEICNLYNMFNTRYKVNKAAYFHTVTCGVELMISRALEKANNHIVVHKDEHKNYSIYECHKNMAAFIKLTDSVIFDILNIDLNGKTQQAIQDLNDAKGIILRIFQRDLYICVHETLPLTTKDLPSFLKKCENINEIEKEILGRIKTETSLDDKEVIVKVINFHFGMKDENPVERLKVYSKQNMNEARHLKKEEASIIFGPVNFNEIIVRVYSTNSDRDRCALIAETSRAILETVHKESYKPEHNDVKIMEIALRTNTVFNDPIHGHIEMNSACMAIINTPEFQRLRFVKQLGLVYFVFPGASHNRFEHSLGMCHLSLMFINTLKENEPNLDITEQDILCVQLAALCHSLGHGPLSHFFEEKYIPNHVDPNVANWKYVDTSVAMFEYIVDKHGLMLSDGILYKEYHLDNMDIIFIKEMIRGTVFSESENQGWGCKGRGKEKAFLYEIVCNKRNGIDVNKFEYFARDCFQLNITNTFDYNRYMKFARVIEVNGIKRICIRDKEIVNLPNMYNTSWTLHKNAYQHRVKAIIETMVLDALLKAESHLKFYTANGCEYTMTECLQNLEAFTLLNDDVIDMICRSTSEDPEMISAKSLIQRIRKRKFYKCVYESKPLMTAIVQSKSYIKKLIAEECQRHAQVNESFIVIDIAQIDFGMKGQNPIENINVFSKSRPDVARKLNDEEVRRIMSSTMFSEVVVRILYCGDEEDDEQSHILEAIRLAAEMWTDNLEMSETS